MPTPYHTLSDDTLNLLAERGNAQALMELAHRAERLGILAEAQELANRLREDLLRREDLLKRLSDEAQKFETAGPPHIRSLLLEAKVEIERLLWKEANRLRKDCGFQEDGKPEPDIPDPSREPVCICDDGRSGHCPVHDVTW